MRLYAKHVFATADTYAYCLLKNHFHFLIRIKEDISGLKNFAGPSQPLSNFFNAYARAFNNTYGRSGALFERPFERVSVTTNAHFVRLITYIHQNPQKHGFVSDFRDWPYSSYHALLSHKASRLQRDTVLEWFNGHQQLEEAHQPMITDQDMAALAPDDFD